MDFQLLSPEVLLEWEGLFCLRRQKSAWLSWLSQLRFWYSSLVQKTLEEMILCVWSEFSDSFLK